MIAYLDSSVLVRAYLADEQDHERVVQLLADPDLARVTGSWTRIEISGALVRAARARRGDESALLDMLEADLATDGPVAVVEAPQRGIEQRALALVRQRGIRAMDAWHLAVAQLVLPALAEAGEQQAFATRDEQQADAARGLGFVVL